MIPYGKQCIDESDIDAVVQALRGDLITTGPTVEKFELALSNFVKAETFVVNSGTAALHSAYFGVGISPGDEVITPPNTFVATQATAANLGAKIIFADIDPRTGLLSASSVEEKLTAKTKAIVLVDYAGQPCDIDSFRELIGSRKIFLIEDAAHSLGSSYKGKRVGSLADVTTFSFYPTKNITTGEGGAVSSNNPQVIKRAKRFSRQGLVKDSSDFILEPEGPWHQEVHDFGLNYRLTDFQCALGLSQLSKIEKFKDKRKALFDRYQRNFNENSKIRTIKVSKDVDVMWHLFPVFVEPAVREALVFHLRQNGFSAQVNYFPASSHPVFIKEGSINTSVPNAIEFYRQEISLPMHVNLDLECVDEISRLVNKFLDA